MKPSKIVTAILALVLCVSCTFCAGCKNKKNGEGRGEDGEQTTIAKPVNPIRDPEHHYVEGGLHKVNVTQSERSFAVNGVSDYKILLGMYDDELAQSAAFLQKHVQNATGARLTIEYYNAATTVFNADTHYIVLHCPELFAAAGLTMPADKIGQTGYFIKSYGNNVFMTALGMYGYRHAVISFMHHTLGYEMYSSDIVVYDKKGDTLPDFDIVERPDFDFYLQGNAISDEAKRGMGFMSETEVFIPVDGKVMHNTFAYLPKNKFQSAHPDWYADDGQQLCYTVHGDRNEGEYEAMTTAVYDRIVELLEANPNVDNITFTHEDVHPQCSCDACAASVETYGTYSAAIIKFVNAVSRKVQAYLEADAQASGKPKREFNILFFAYDLTERAPATLNAQGEYEPIDESVVCDDNVGVYIAPIHALYNKSFYDDANVSTATTIRSWRACAKKIYMWLYETNYNYYFYPLNSYDTMGESYRFCFENGAMFMYNEGQYNQGNVTHFSKLKEYFNSKAEFDVNVKFADVADDFFANYFREAGVPMRRYFDELQVQLRYLEETYPTIVTGGIYCDMAQDRFWPKRLLDHWLELCDEAYAAIEPYREKDPELYAALKKNILLETMFPRYALIDLHAGSYGAGGLRDMRLQFKADAETLNLHRHSEGESLDSLYKSWNI